ncbi:MAG: GNAT family N-acetyltransferase [Eubacteriales bacterium]|nr:GNAT family N-acetyltransferase [Eubacteriales bacterium]
MVEVQEANIEEAATLLQELNDILAGITGASGAGSFKAEDVASSRGAFVIAYLGGAAVGCGALRERSESTAEIKRVFARPNKSGVGSAILKKLEEKSRLLGYSELVLETRKVNTAAVAFYQKNGYRPCANYGQYANQPEAICFSKRL